MLERLWNLTRITSYCKSENEEIVLALNDVVHYESLSGLTSGDFASVAETAVDVKFEGNGSVVLLEPIALPACSNNDPDAGNYCVSSEGKVNACIINTHVVYITDGDTCNPLASDNSNAIENVLFNADNEIVSEVDAESEIAMAYHCTFDSSVNGSGKYDNVGCSFIKGYVICDDYIVNCNGWKNDVCVVKAKNSSETCSASAENGSLVGKGNKICIESTPVALPTEEMETIVIKLKGTSSLYGKSDGEILLLSTSNTEIMIIKPGKYKILSNH